MSIRVRSLFTLVASIFITSLFLALLITFLSKSVPFVGNKPGGSSAGTITSGIVKFKSSEEFSSYISKGDSYGAAFGRAETTLMVPSSAAIGDSVKAVDPSSAVRISETNVQVAGIDEPDIVKTDGKQIYFSQKDRYYYGKPVPMELDVTMERKIAPPQPVNQSTTRIIGAFPPSALKEKGSIKEVGDLLLDGSTLLVFGQDNSLYGYDVTKPESPQKEWSLKLKDNTSLKTARLKDGKVYVITESGVNRSKPCPIEPYTMDGRGVSIPCTDIYHPVSPTSADVTYTAFILKPTNGEIEKRVSFTGSRNGSVVYMSNNALYVTNSYSLDYVAFFYQFFQEDGKGLVSDDTLRRISDLQSYNISQQAKMVELMSILTELQSTFESDEALKMQNELTNKMGKFAKNHLRDFDKTGITKIDLGSFGISATGIVTGKPLNQFALDEENGVLRVATTIGLSGGFWGVGNSDNNVSEVTTFDKGLGELGNVSGLGKGERIYSVRFIGNRGYVVTFKQVDPFYVLDLSNARSPKVTGELKIPGFSSYLHPVDSGRVLGVGRENGKVKLSLFDVSDAENPQEVDKYTLDEYSSETLQDYHAFLMDDKHKVFFLPATKGGYIFSYASGELELKKTVADFQVKRALYLNDYLYVVGNDRIVVLDQKDWSTVKELEF